jgi:hypothetical protein
MNKVELIDKLIEIEDQYEEESKKIVKEKVYSKMDELYGKDGTRICDIYYNEETETQTNDECKDCSDKAKSLIDLINTSTTITESLLDSKYDSIVSELNFLKADILDIIKKIEKRCNDRNITTNEIILRNILLKLIMKQFTDKEDETNRRRKS